MTYAAISNTHAKNCYNPYLIELSNCALMWLLFEFPALIDVHTVTWTTTAFHQCSKPWLNKTRCERGTWSLYSLVPWLLVASRFLGLARTNWYQTELFENYCEVHFVPRGSSPLSPSLCNKKLRQVNSLRCFDPIIIDWTACGCWGKELKCKVEGYNHDIEK